MLPLVTGSKYPSGTQDSVSVTLSCDQSEISNLGSAEGYFEAFIPTAKAAKLQTALKTYLTKR